jgi:hypothetical protein
MIGEHVGSLYLEHTSTNQKSPFSDGILSEISTEICRFRDFFLDFSRWFWEVLAKFSLILASKWSGTPPPLEAFE